MPQSLLLQPPKEKIPEKRAVNDAKRKKQHTSIPLKLLAYVRAGRYVIAAASADIAVTVNYIEMNILLVKITTSARRGSPSTTPETLVHRWQACAPARNC